MSSVSGASNDFFMWDFISIVIRKIKIFVFRYLDKERKNPPLVFFYVQQFHASTQ